MPGGTVLGDLADKSGGWCASQGTAPLVASFQSKQMAIMRPSVVAATNTPRVHTARFEASFFTLCWLGRWSRQRSFLPPAAIEPGVRPAGPVLPLEADQ